MKKELNITVMAQLHPDIDFTIPEFERIRAISPDLHFHILEDDELTEEVGEKTDIIYGCPPLSFLPKCPNLQWLQLASAGAAPYCDMDLYNNKDVMITNATGVYGAPIAEHLMALILSVLRKVDFSLKKQLDHTWERPQPIFDLFGSTVGILGAGDIGLALAKRLRAFEVKKIIGIKKHVGECPEELDELYGMEDLDKVLAQSDVVAICLPGTDDTKHLLNRETIAKMKPGSIVVNIGRGSIIEQNALIEALESGHIAAAGLDVVDPEPLPENDPLWDAPHVLITGHSAGGSPTNPQRNFAIFENNLRHFLAGEELENKVDVKLQY